MSCLVALTVLLHAHAHINMKISKKEISGIIMLGTFAVSSFYAGFFMYDKPYEHVYTQLSECLILIYCLWISKSSKILHAICGGFLGLSLCELYDEYQQINTKVRLDDYIFAVVGISAIVAVILIDYYRDKKI